MNSADPTSSTEPDAEQSQTDNAQTTGDCPRETNEAVDQLVTGGDRLVHPSTLPPAQCCEQGERKRAGSLLVVFLGRANFSNAVPFSHATQNDAP
jgi:hypothetical protein